MRYPSWTAPVWLGLLIGGCSFTQPNPAPVVEAGVKPDQIVAASPGEPVLQMGLKQYEQAQYKRAASTLQQAIDSGLTPKSQVLAHKHLAFIYCISNRIGLCRSEFLKAVTLDPRFDLAPAEAGHPQWGPVFRSVKSNQPAAS
jgi:Tfp pilus assembly protein PilF